MKRRHLAALGLLLLLPMAAGAHEPRVGPHGGTLVDAGPYHVEVVAKGTTLEVLVSDSADRPLPSLGFKGTAILVVDGKSQRITLEPAGQARLAGRSAVPLASPPKGAILLTNPAGQTAQARLN